MEKKSLKKILVIAIIFMLTFSNCGYTLQALATTEGLGFLELDLFNNPELDFKAYFLDANAEEQMTSVADVNGKMTLVVELEPKVEGYLKKGTIKAIAEEGETNFEITEVVTKEEQDEIGLTTFAPVAPISPELPLLKTEQVLDLEESDNSVDKNNVIATNTVDSENVLEENNVENNTTVTNTVVNDAATETEENNNVENANTVDETNTVVDNTIADNVVEETTETEEKPTEEEDELVDEDAVATEKIEEEKDATTEVIKNAAKSTIVSGTEIEIENVIKATKLYITVQFKPGETLDVTDLYKAIKIELTGKYINVDLEEVEIVLDAEVEVGWSYSKAFEVSSTYTKVSPFEVVGTKGTLIENKIVVTRNIEDEKYLPVKQTKVEIEVPELSGKKPIAMEVSASKLKATRGEEINEVVFSKENWNYNEETNILNITVDNSDAKYTYGEDIYTVTYRYEDYVEENEIELQTKGKVAVEEYSGKENNVITKEFDEKQKIIVNVGELITYSIGTTEEKINKAKINANYNSEEAIYETEFTSTVNVNILTNDVLKEFKIKDTKEFYIDKQNLEFEAQDVKYRKIKFKYDEIAELLEKGGIIEIKCNSGELLYTLNSELIKSQENCELELKGEITGVEISFQNISVNGNMTIDFVKAIGKSNFDKSAFSNFEKLESRIKAEVKYEESEISTELPEIKTEKYFENSFTKAEINIEKEALTTTSINENVEIKIELNNHLETSDLYVNPVFEIVFPKYVKNVEVKATNLLYEDELKVKSTVVYKDEDIVKMQVALEGVQTKFSTGTLTKGTNIIINTNIELDKYTPKKDDQIRMYYYNEAVTNYESQTKWTVKTDIPTGILKTTNGFDVEVISYQAPNGFVAVNEIENYDGQNSIVGSIKQGEETRQVARENAAQVATMNLIAMNNTGNHCTDVALLGRIPNKEATDVKTGENLGNNVDTAIMTGIVEDVSNPISADIYYSSNPKATKDLSDGRNAWTQRPEDISQMKSFLIVPTGTVNEGTVFKYTYNFLIPENLPYEAKMYGSFGAFYNNYTDIAVMYETTVADKVGLITEAGPKVEAVMSVNIGDGAEILEERMMKYTITVKNTGSVDLTDIIIEDKIPNFTRKCVPASNLDTGDNGYETTNAVIETWNVPILAAGEIVEKTLLVRTTTLPDTFEEYCTVMGYIENDENGRYKYKANGEKEYISEIPENIYAENKATIKVGNLATEIETNTIKNLIKHANFNIETRTYKQKEILSTNEKFSYVVTVGNISLEPLNNVVIETALPKEIEFIGLENAEEYTYELDKETNILKIKVGTLEVQDIARPYINCKITNMKNVATKNISNQIVVYADNNIKEYGTRVEDKVIGALLNVTQDTSVDKALEYEPFNIVVNVKNTGEKESDKVNFKVIVPEELEIISVSEEGNKQIVTDIISNVVTGETNSIDFNGNSALVIKVRSKLLSDNEPSKKVVVNAEVSEAYIGNLHVEPLEIEIVQNPDNPKTDEEIAEEEKNNTSDNPEANDSYLDDIKKEQEENTEINNGEDETTDNDDNNSNKDVNNENSNDEENGDEEKSDEENENTEDNTDNQNEEVKNVKIIGQVWIDKDKNGIREDSEELLSKVKVTLQRHGATVKAVTTDSTGTYRFEDLSAGEYSVLFEYDSEKYLATTYKKADVDDTVNSDAIELTEGTAVTNNFEIQSGELVLDFGLQEKDSFNFASHKYITKAIVTTKNKTTEHEYNSLDLAKLEIKSKELKNTSITFEYKIIVENIGNVPGHAETVVDYMPTDLEFVQSKNPDWEINTDGNLYNKTLKEVELQPGEKRELTLYLNKVMTNDNTGVISNKVAILGLNSEKDSTEDVQGNESTQEIIVTVSTGRTVGIVFTIVLAMLAFLAGYATKTGKIDLFKINLNKNFKRVYK